MPDAELVYEFEGYRLDPGRRRLSDPGGRPVALRAKVFDTLRVLVERAGEPVSKSELLEAVWASSVVEENNLNQAISALRQALGDDRQDPKFIATITGRGYQFVAPVARVAAEAEAAGAGDTAAGSRRNLAVAAVAGLALLAGIAWLANSPDEEPAPAIDIDEARLVTSESGNFSMPTLSPDGRMMAFVNDRTGVEQIWVKSLPDGAPLQITDGEEPATWPSWSPVGDDILFQRARPDGLQSVWLVDALGRTRPRIVVADAQVPRFAADGRSFVFSRRVSDVYIGSLDSGETRRLTGMPETPGFAPQMAAMNAAGDIAFVLADEGPSANLWVYEAASGEFRKIGGARSAYPGEWARTPAWLPDGRTILYAAADEDPANSHLWRADVGTGETARISTGVGGYGDVAISGDGSRLAYSYARAPFRLVRTDPATGTDRTIYQTRNMIALPQVSPDGRTIVFFGENVYTLDVDGGEPERRSFGEPGEATLPAWSRDSEHIYYYRGRSLHRIDPATGSDELVLEDFHWSSSNWLAVGGGRLAYWNHSRPSGPDRTVVYDLDTGEETILDDPILPADFSRDGRALLGRRSDDAAIMICSVPDFDCIPLMHDGEPIQGAIPRWSADESRVYFRRAIRDRPGYAKIWVVARDGGAPREVAEIGPYDMRSVYFGIAHDDTIIWNSHDRLGSSEIWLVDLSGRAGQAAGDSD